MSTPSKYAASRAAASPMEPSSAASPLSDASRRATDVVCRRRNSSMARGAASGVEARMCSSRRESAAWMLWRRASAMSVTVVARSSISPIAIDPSIETSAVSTTPSATSAMMRLRIDNERQRGDVSRFVVRRFGRPFRRFDDRRASRVNAGGGVEAGPALTMALVRSCGAPIGGSGAGRATVVASSGSASASSPRDGSRTDGSGSDGSAATSAIGPGSSDFGPAGASGLPKGSSPDAENRRTRLPSSGPSASGVSAAMSAPSSRSDTGRGPARRRMARRRLMPRAPRSRFGQ